MRNFTGRTLTRWLEIADSPAAFAGFFAAILLTAVAASCTSTSSSTSSAPGRPVRTPVQTPARATEAATQGEPLLRIRIAEKLTTVRLGGPSQILVGPADRPDAARSLPTPVTVTRATSGWFLRDAAGAPVAFGDAKPGARTPLSVRSPSGDALLTIDDRPYPGELILHARATTASATAAGAAPATGAAAAIPAPGMFDVIELVGLETYLPGVVSSELLPNWSLTAFKAQTVAARSYAIHEQQRSRSRGEVFDLESNQWDQVYSGAVEHAVAKRAVAETRGMVLTTEGRILRAYYSSTCGGRPNAAKNVWPTGPGFEFNLDAPIQGTQGPETACAFSPRNRWTATRPRDELVKRLAGYGRDNNLAIRNLDGLTRVEPVEKTIDGRPTTYRIFDAKGRWYPLSAEQLRSACNWSGGSGLPALTRETRVWSGDVEFKIEGDKVTITGRGFGHGVGMCQYGAEGMSRAGKDFQSILMHYYPGAKLERAY